jgi:serine/threonine-protein kinase
MTPSTIAHYRVNLKLGEGGMGVVWRATDTKLGREVAIKVLPDAFAQDADRMARFTREAQVLASLNHPNIAAIYGVEQRALVMELVPGQTLAERIAQGPMPVEEALPLAIQIAEALEYAHERGVIHRDLKPANIKITPADCVKVLDFGLAKAFSADVSQPDPESSPTLTMRATVAGVILGTAAYMSPEQAKGKPVDRRADMWSFGVVLYEMLTGRPLYSGETVPETLVAVIKDTPDLTALPEQTPAAIRRVLRRCLEKDPRRRLQAIGEVRFMLGEPDEAAAPSTTAPRRHALLPWVIAGALALPALTASWIAWRATRLQDRPMMRFVAELGPDAVAGTMTTVAISPDSSRIVFPIRGPNGRIQLATRLMDQFKVTLLPGSEDGRDAFFSPDGRWIGFFTGDNMKKISVEGGAAVTLCEGVMTSGDRGASWGEDGTIIAALDVFHLFRIPEVGGKPEMLAVKAAAPFEISYRWPQILPGGEAVIVTMGLVGGFEDAAIAVVWLKTGEVKKVVTGGYFGRYLPSGHLIYLHQGTLFAVPFDTQRMQTRGTAAPIQEDIAGNSVNGGGNLDFSWGPSGHGMLVYVSRQNANVTGVLAWLDAAGKKVTLLTPGPAPTPRLSPSGKNLALSIAGDIFNYDLERTAMKRLTFTAAGNRSPVWTPDGKHIVYAPAAGGIWWTRADGSAQPERLTDVQGVVAPQSFSPDGRRLAYFHTGEGILVLSLDMNDPDHPRPGKPEVFLQMPGAFSNAAFSPDGRWLAYSSAESGSSQVYVRPYRMEGAQAAASGKWQISTSPGRFPIWSLTGNELFYETIDGHIMVADYTAKGETFNPGKPRQWTEAPTLVTGAYQNLDLAPDGKRFVVFFAPDGGGNNRGPVHATFLLNFFDELKRRIP